MNPAVEAALKSWQIDAGIFALLLLAGLIYARGWLRLHRQMARRFSSTRLASFFIGITIIIIAIASPLDAFANLLLTAHMTQHLLLMMVAPPLLLYGEPFLPLLRGLPESALKNGAGPFLAWSPLQRIGRFITHPLFGWSSFVSASVVWHMPVCYELALHSQFWHEVEHLTFLTTAILFWWPIVQPWPSRAQWPRWMMIPYLFLADFQNTALSAFLIFCERVIYPTYANAPRVLKLSPLEDQAAAGAIMWVPGSIVFLLPLILITIELLDSRRRGVLPSSLVVNPANREASKPIKLVQLSKPRRRASWDLLTVPVIGAMLRWKHLRRAAQIIMFAIALIIVADGLFGHQMGSMNLAGVLPWIHWRGLVVITLLLAGNFICMVCPFMLTRDLARRFFPARLRWPQALRSKWLAVVLLAIFFWAYEAFALWDSPRWTAWIIIGYFIAATAIDGLFRGANFCKYLCPIGQFNFIQSIVSPLEVKVNNLDICRSCTTYDCIRGNDKQRGCELQLFLPRKAGNLDCTFCLDCINACPHQNIGLLAIAPAHQLMHDRPRSSIGRLSKRLDIAALALLLVFAAFINAAGMVGPVADWEVVLQKRIGANSLLPIITGLALLSLIILPGILAGICGLLSKLLSGLQVRWQDLTVRFVMALVPLGFSMWLAHFVFHLITGARATVPVIESAAIDFGWRLFSNPDWSSAVMSAPFDWLSDAQIIILDLGLLLSLYTGWRIAIGFTNRKRNALAMLLPWAMLALSLYIFGVWLLFQPMQMRGMVHQMVMQ